MYDTLVPRAVLSQHQSTIAPNPLTSEDHVGLAIAPISSLFGSLVPANAHRRPARARSTFRAVA